MARKRILLVDDYAPFATSLGMALSVEHDVEVTGSGAEALASLETPGFDAVLCDVMMPGMSGIEVYQKVQQASPRLAKRFVFLTAGVLSEEAHTFLAEAGNPTMRKPFELQALCETLAQLWSDEAPRGRA
ncbi:MAG: response regulator [Myxococcaceae bacterium]